MRTFTIFLALFFFYGSLMCSAEAKVQTEVLYSWQKLSEVLQWAAINPKGLLFSNNYLYAWRTPTATFAYGDLPIRIKLKKDVNFVELKRDERNCSNFTSAKNDFSVYYIWLDATTMDYLLCSPKVMHSWSFATPEGLQEIKNEYISVKADPTKGDLYAGNYDAYLCKECLFGSIANQQIIGWKMQSLDEKISFLEKISNTEFGRVFCLEKSSDCDLEHFQLSTKTIFGPVPLTHRFLHSSPVPKPVKNSLYINPKLFVSDKYSGSKFLSSYKSIDIKKLPGINSLGCIDHESSGCEMNFASLSEEDNDYLLGVDDKPDQMLLGYVLRASSVVRVSKFSELVAQLYKPIALRSSLNQILMKTTFSGFYMYFSKEDGTCIQQDLFHPETPSTFVQKIYCDINS